MIKGRRTTRHLYREFRDIDYFNKLSDKDKRWMIQFMYEYYQGDFNFEKNIHPDHMRKDCYLRNHRGKDQIHSVGQDLLDEATVNAILKQMQASSKANTPYSILDYIKDFFEKR